MGNRRKLVAMRLGRLAQKAGICWRSKMGSEIGVVEGTYIAARYRKQSSNWKGGLSDDSEERHAMGETTLQRMRKQRGSTRRRFGVPALRKAVRVRITQSGVTGHVGGARKRPLRPHPFAENAKGWATPRKSYESASLLNGVQHDVLLPELEACTGHVVTYFSRASAPGLLVGSPAADRFMAGPDRA